MSCPYYLLSMRTPFIKIVLISLLLFSCDKGLSPDMAAPKVGFSGTINFLGDWDESINQTLVVLFKTPLLSKDDFNVFNLKYVSDTIPSGSQLFGYSTNDNPLINNVEAGEYAYLAVAQSKKNIITLNREDWFIVGVYYLNDDLSQPGKLVIPEATFVTDVNIICDFNNPPPQPPGGVELLNKLKAFLQNK